MNRLANWWMSVSAAVKAAAFYEKPEKYTKQVADQIVHEFQSDRSKDAYRIAQDRLYFLKGITEIDGNTVECRSIIARAEMTVNNSAIARR